MDPDPLSLMTPQELKLLQSQCAKGIRRYQRRRKWRLRRARWMWLAILDRWLLKTLGYSLVK